jgi:molybdate transport system ATP-binding protein
MRPRLLLLDEPLASLDAARKNEIFPFLERLRDEAAVPMVYVSHDAAEVRRLATSVVRIEAGRVAAQGGLELLDPGTSPYAPASAHPAHPAHVPRPW